MYLRGFAPAQADQADQAGAQEEDGGRFRYGVGVSHENHALRIWIEDGGKLGELVVEGAGELVAPADQGQGQVGAEEGGLAIVAELHHCIGEEDVVEGGVEQVGAAQVGVDQ